MKWINIIKRWINNNIQSIQCRWIKWVCSNKLAINSRIKITTDKIWTGTWIIQISSCKIKYKDLLWLWTILLNINNTHLCNFTTAIHHLIWCTTWTPPILSNFHKLVVILTNNLSIHNINSKCCIMLVLWILITCSMTKEWTFMMISNIAERNLSEKHKKKKKLQSHKKRKTTTTSAECLR